MDRNKLPHKGEYHQGNGATGRINSSSEILLRRKQLEFPDSIPVDSIGISSQLDQIFEPQRSTSIFQNHFPRNSAIIEMLKISHFQTIYNIFVAILLIAFVNTLLYNFYESGTILDFELLVWYAHYFINPMYRCFADFPSAILIWCTMFTFSFSAFLLQRAIVEQKLSTKTVYMLYTICFCVMYLCVPYIVRIRKMPPATAAVQDKFNQCSQCSL